MTADRATLERLTAQVKQLEAENRALRDDLGFFEKLIPAAKSDGVTIRGLKAELVGGAQLKWQVLVIQAAAARNAPEFKGRLELVLAGVLNGKPWTQAFPPEGQAIQFRQYRRLGGVFALPLNVVVKTVTARVYEGQTIRAIQAVDLD